MIHELRLLKDSYKDSVRLLEATRSLQSTDGVEYGWAVMASPTNIETLTGEGFDIPTDASANDLVIAIRATNERTVTEAVALAEAALFAATVAADVGTRPLEDLRMALAEQPDSNLAIVSVPGPYAALETHKALSSNLDVLLFSDNVSLEDEIELKTRAVEMGRLVMGPGAGTAMIAGTGLGFANRVKPLDPNRPTVGVVAAAGTGAQEVMSLLDRWDVGVSHVIGVGGRDLSADVGGLMARAGIAALEADDSTDAILLVSKPPSPEVAASLLGAVPSKPMVAALIGLQEPLTEVPPEITVCNTLEQGAVLALNSVDRQAPDVIGSTPESVADVITTLKPTRRRLVGLFSGGTLCYEAMTIAVPHIGAIHSNTPLDKSWTVPAPEGAHVCLDLGEEEYTQGKPHPMIDPEARLEWLTKQIDDPTVAVVLLDVVIGDGSHTNPASLLAPVAQRIIEAGGSVVSYVLGTPQDPQGLDAQRKILQNAGCIVAETAARAALAAAAIVNRDPGLVHADLGE